MSLEVQPVRSRSERRRFVNFAWSIYAGDPFWVPPLKIERHAFLNRRKHPFFRHGSAQAWLATDRGRVVGRILAADDPRFNQIHNTQTGTFGLFECVDDPVVAAALLETAIHWLRARGLKHALGPIDYSTNYACGLLVEGFGSSPKILLNYNPPYYAELIDAAGLRKAKDLYTYAYNMHQGIPARWLRVAERSRKRNRVHVRPVNLKDYDNELARIEAIYNRAWEDNWAAVPMTHAEFVHMGRNMKELVFNGLLLIAEADGEPAGFAMTIPDINPTLQRIGNGRLLPTGFLRLLGDLRPGGLMGLRTIALGVLPGFRKRGITELLILETIASGQRLSMPNVELGWTLEDNDLMNRAIENLGGSRIRRYRIYERMIA